MARQVSIENIVGRDELTQQIWAMIKSQYALTDKQHIVQMLRDLALDHYLISDTQKRYSFRFPLIQSWWKTAQGLTA